MTLDVVIRKALGTQETLVGHPEHCSVDPACLAALRLVLGSQIRVRRGTAQVAVYTISETREESTDSTVRMALVARERLDTSEEFDAIIDTQVVNPTLTDEEARASSEFVERLDDDRQQRELVVLAPHGGTIEEHTDDQAEHFASSLARTRVGVSVWRCRGFRTGGGAFARWHITSTDINEASFPLLKTIRHRRFAYAVAFHGMSKPGVIVGGGAPLALKQRIAEVVRSVLAGSKIDVRVADPSEDNDGDSPDNIVNRLTASGTYGVQIEQSLEARECHGMAIADVVAGVYRAQMVGRP